MKKKLRLWAALAIGGFAMASCAYDPYYTSGSVSYGYGDGYGYGGSSFSTSLFVSTGNPRWGYDPYCHSYYDYTSRRYYDPYLYGYYPVGYRPPVIIGVPHPRGWRAGQYCPPPSRVRNVTINNYRNRETLYRNSSYSWSGQVRQQPSGGGYRGSQQRPEPSRNPGRDDFRRPQQPSWNGNRDNGRQNPRQPGVYQRDRQGAGRPGFDTPVSTRPDINRNPSLPIPDRGQRGGYDRARDFRPDRSAAPRQQPVRQVERVEPRQQRVTPPQRQPEVRPAPSRPEGRPSGPGREAADRRRGAR